MRNARRKHFQHVLDPDSQVANARTAAAVHRFRKTKNQFWANTGRSAVRPSSSRLSPAMKTFVSMIARTVLVLRARCLHFRDDLLHRLDADRAHAISN